MTVKGILSKVFAKLRIYYAGFHAETESLVTAYNLYDNTKVPLLPLLSINIITHPPTHTHTPPINKTYM